MSHPEEPNNALGSFRDSEEKRQLPVIYKIGMMEHIQDIWREE